jgi:hypothetical protein
LGSKESKAKDRTGSQTRAPFLLQKKPAPRIRLFECSVELFHDFNRDVASRGLMRFGNNGIRLGIGTLRTKPLHD